MRCHASSKVSAGLQAAFGTPLGKPTIDGIAIDVYSNGDCRFVSDSKTYDAAGGYLGIAYQCVEFVRRFVYMRHGVNLAGRWQEGDARDWFDCRETMGLAVVSADEARAGDILTFTGGKWGHVGIVADREGDALLMTSQNFLNNAEDVGLCLSSGLLKGAETVRDALGTEMAFQSVLRL